MTAGLSVTTLFASIILFACSRRAIAADNVGLLLFSRYSEGQAIGSPNLSARHNCRLNHTAPKLRERSNPIASNFTASASLGLASSNSSP